MKNHVQIQHQLSLEERIEIYRLTKQGLSNRKIAQQLNRHRSTIDRELSRNSHPFTSEYSPLRAQNKATLRAKQQRCQAPLKNPAVFLYVREHLRIKWTPEQIAGRLSIDVPGEAISYETIYQYIYGFGRKDKLWCHLVRHHKKRKRKKSYQTNCANTRLKHTVSIEKRPTKANNRTQVGHWETDLMESNRSVSTNASVHIERKTRYTKLQKLTDKKAQTKQKSMQETLQLLQSVSKSKRPIIKSVTYDNGSENAYHYKLSKNMQIKGYICHPYQSWERGSVENVIGRVRRFIPKGTDITMVSEIYLQQVENWINNAPLKCLGWLTPTEAMEQEVNKYKFRNYRKVLSQSGAFPD